MLKATSKFREMLAAGLWLSKDQDANAGEIDELNRLKREVGLRQVPLIVVGSEALWRGDLSVQGLITYMKQVQAIAPGIPVTTAEPWHILLGLDHRYPPAEIQELVSSVSALAANIHPYWEQICPEAAVGAVFDRLQQLQAAYPTKPILISETGWPSAGEVNGCAVPSLEHQRQFLTDFLCQAHAEGIGFFYFSAFDEDWKAPPDVETYWGFFTANRTPKQPFTTLRRCPT